MRIIKSDIFKERKDNVFNALFIVKCLCYCKLNVKHWIIMDAIIVSLVDFCKIFFSMKKILALKCNNKMFNFNTQQPCKIKITPR